MNKLAKIPYDFYDFLDKDMREPLSEILEPMVKRGSAQIPALEDLTDLDDSKYALILTQDNGTRLKKLAHHTPELCEINAAVFEKVARYLPIPLVKTAATNLKRAAEDWDIELSDFYKEGQAYEFVPNEVNISNLQMVTPHDSLFKEETNVEHILTKEAQEAIKNPFARQEAIYYLHKHAHRMDVNERLVYSKNLWTEMEKANEPNGFIEKRASLDSHSLRNDVKSLMNERLYWVSGDKEKEAQYAAVWEKRASWSPLTFCQMLESADRKTGVAKQWGSMVSYPEEALSPFKKEASYRDITQLDKELIEQVVGAQTASALFGEDGEAVWRSLPKPIQEELLEMV